MIDTMRNESSRLLRLRPMLPADAPLVSGWLEDPDILHTFTTLDDGFTTDHVIDAVEWQASCDHIWMWVIENSIGEAVGMGNTKADLPWTWVHEF